MNTRNYPLVVFYSEEDEGWLADFPDFKYCTGFGETPQEAITEMSLKPLRDGLNLR